MSLTAPPEAVYPDIDAALVQFKPTQKTMDMRFNVTPESLLE